MTITTILIADDEISICRILERYFDSKGFNVLVSHDGAGALELLSQKRVDVALLDLRLPDMNGLEALEKIKALSPGTAVVIITAFGDVETAVKAMQLKADNFVQKPLDLVLLEAIVRKTLDNYRVQTEVQDLKRQVSLLTEPQQCKGLRLPPEIFHAIELLAENPATNVLIMGETGTGKGMVAAAIHCHSRRAERPFIDVNCAGLSHGLLESELFGHERGAFTDAKNEKKGLLEVADGGSIFLDEIGDLSGAVQAKLLKVIEEKSFRRLGGTTSIEVDVRIIAATNVNLEQAVAAGRFRKDLYFRLNVLPIILPPLRDRAGEIMPLVRIFLDEFNAQFGKQISGLTPEAEAMLATYMWPGNIRELKNVMERAALLCDGRLISPAELPANLQPAKRPSGSGKTASRATLEEMEIGHIRKVLADCGHNHSQAAAILGIHRSTLIKKIKKYGLSQ